MRQCKYLNKIVEQDHRAIKRVTRPMMGFKNFHCAQSLIAGIETMQMIRKGQMKSGPERPSFVQSRAVQQLGILRNSAHAALPRQLTVVATEPSLLAGALPGVRAMLEADRTRIPRAPLMAIISAIFAFDPLPPLAAYAGPKLVIDATRADNPGALFRQAPGIPYQLIDGTSH